MKKILGVFTLAILVCAVLVGCSGGSTVAPAWADREELVYNVTDTKTGETLGTMTVVNERRPEDKTLNGKTYDADGRTPSLISFLRRRLPNSSNIFPNGKY